MNSKMNGFLIFCFVLMLDIDTEAKIARCDYSYRVITNDIRFNNSQYSCDLNIKQQKGNYYNEVTRIDGQHLRRQDDESVKWIFKNLVMKLKIFSSIFCDKFPNLELIDFKDAEMELIDEDSLLNCKDLIQLTLLRNEIRELPENLLIGNSKLTELWISINQLTTLPENLFLNQKEIEDLYLYDNQINFLPSNIFRQLVKLEKLFLFNNKLQSINPEWFVNLQNLKYLALNGNQISEIPSKCFASLRNLEELFLYENRVKTLKSDNFDSLQNLQLLSLQINEISDLPVGVFTQLNNLQELRLSDNKLTTIHSDSFGVHNQLKNVWLQDNKIHAIDEKFIDNTAVLTISMINNICSQLDTKIKSKIKPNLKKCFDNYQLRPQPQVSHPSPQSLNQYATSNQDVCGQSSRRQRTETRIIGGSKISRGSFPWIAALVTPDGQFFCGGTLISNRNVLTAAHCIQDKHTSKATIAGEIVVLLGVHDLNMTLEVERLLCVVQAVNVHPGWNTTTKAYDADIAMLILESEVTFNKYIKPICMPNSNVAAIKTGIVVGFGKSEDTTKIHENIPKMLETPIHSNEDCFFHDYRLVKLSSKRTFCGGTGTGIGVCKGDSGSGLFVTYESAYYLRGIVSSSIIGGRYGCDVDTYSVFTDVTKYVSWINEISMI